MLSLDTKTSATKSAIVEILQIFQSTSNSPHFLFIFSKGNGVNLEKWPRKKIDEFNFFEFSE